MVEQISMKDDMVACAFHKPDRTSLRRHRIPCHMEVTLSRETSQIAMRMKSTSTSGGECIE